MPKEISKTQTDRLGDRLKKGNITEEDLRLLDEHRRSFMTAYENVVEVIRNELLLQPTGRPAKSTTSISEKLRRESIRLTQIQDIAGCRLIVTDIARQELVVRLLSSVFLGATISDRRVRPSHGYRAIHIIVNREDKPVEIQVRTALQHLWAELSEKLSDVIDPAIKYGGGTPAIQEILAASSNLVAHEESQELQLTNLRTPLADSSGVAKSAPKDENERVLDKQIEDLWKNQIAVREALYTYLQKAIDRIPGSRRD